jgi:hypothetical protein
MNIYYKKIIMIVESFDINNTPDMKYYAFDWDDNIVFMPTEIILLDNNDEEVGMSTHDFAKYRGDIGKKDFKYRGTTIVNYANLPFRQFKVEGDEQFLKDIMIAKTGPAFSDFKEAINNGSIFSIITARGHNPETLKKAVKIYIDNDFNGISNKRVIHNLKKYRDLTDFESEGDIIDDYLDLCKFYPVSFGSGSAANPEDEKVKALNEFYDYCKSMAKKIKKAFSFKNDIKGEALKNLKFSIGFSDDDPKNIETIKNKVNKPELTIYSTNKGNKEKV